jgi:hypothetical protein
MPVISVMLMYFLANVIVWMVIQSAFFWTEMAKRPVEHGACGVSPIVVQRLCRADGVDATCSVDVVLQTTRELGVGKVLPSEVS